MRNLLVGCPSSIVQLEVRCQLILSPPEFIERLEALVPPPRRHRMRYCGVLAPNAGLRPAVTALAPECAAPATRASNGTREHAYSSSDGAELGEGAWPSAPAGRAICGSRYSRASARPFR